MIRREQYLSYLHFPGWWEDAPMHQAEIKLEYLPQLLKDPLGCTKQSNVIYGTTRLSSMQLRKEDLVKQGL